MKFKNKVHGNRLQLRLLGNWETVFLELYAGTHLLFDSMYLVVVPLLPLFVTVVMGVVYLDKAWWWSSPLVSWTFSYLMGKMV